MDKIEAIIFIVVLVAAVIGLYYVYAGTGEAIRTLPGCKGGFTMELTGVGLSPKLADEYHFRGVSGTIELLDIQGSKAKLLVDGIETPFLGFRQIYFGDKVAIQMSEVKSDRVAFCLASNAVECMEYGWNYDTKRRECRKWISQADTLYR